MEYKYCQNENFKDFASGRVIIHKSGYTNFPVRLAQEIYSRCLSYLRKKEEICIYDPCCGGGYLLTSIGFLNSDSIKTIVCSDFDSEALKVTRQNLSLLTFSGLNERLDHLHDLYEQFKKTSHLQAIESVGLLKGTLEKYESLPDTQIFQADILSKDILTDMDFKADIVFTDVPYGNLVSWQGNELEAMSVLLDNLVSVLKPKSVVAVCSDKHQKILHDKYIRLEKHQIGKRKFEILTLR